MTAGGRRSGRGWWVVAAALGVVLLFCVGIIWAGAMNDDDGNPLIENTGTVLVGLFALIGSLGAALIAKLAPPLKVLTDNVQNDHKDEDGKPILLRDDQDRMHAEALAAQEETKATVAAQITDFQAVVLAAIDDFRKEVGRDIGGLRAENRSDRDDANGRIAALDRRLTNHIDQKGLTE